MIKTVIFDLDDTLYDYTNGHRMAMYAVCTYFREEFNLSTEETSRMFQQILERQLTEMGPVAASHTRILRFQQMLEELDLPIFPHAMILTDLYWNTLMGISRPEPGIQDLLAMLKENGIRLGIGTNMVAMIQYRKLERLKIGEYFDFIVTSEEAGIDKPNDAFFQCCLKKSKATPEEILFIGDSLECDITGARNAGMHTLLYDPKNLHPDAPNRLTDYRSLGLRDLQNL